MADMRNPGLAAGVREENLLSGNASGNTRSATPPQDTIVSTAERNSRSHFEFVHRHDPRGGECFMLRVLERDGKGDLRFKSAVTFSPLKLALVRAGLAELEAFRAKREGCV